MCKNATHLCVCMCAYRFKYILCLHCLLLEDLKNCLADNCSFTNIFTNTSASNDEIKVC